MNDATIATTDNMHDIMDALQKAAWISQNTAEQMGFLNKRVTEHDEAIANINHRLDMHESREIINSYQRRQISRAVINRVNHLLKIEYEGGRVADRCALDEQNYRGGFIARCYCDIKSTGKMGDPYGDTLAVDYDAVIEAIEAWVPNVENGTDGYKRYLDIRREERETNKRRAN